jgi:hypothetical protein
MGKLTFAVIAFAIAFLCGLFVIANSQKNAEKKAFRAGWDHGFFSTIIIMEENGSLGNPEVNYSFYQMDSTNYFKSN